MAEHAEKKSNKGFIIVIVIIVIIIGVVIALNSDSLLGLNSSSLNEVLTEENYNEITSEVTDELGDSDDLYYLLYATVYYMAEDGMSAAFSGNEEDSAMYVNIYGKTSQELIEEGKELMEENDVTVEEYKESVSEFTNTITE